MGMAQMGQRSDHCLAVPALWPHSAFLRLSEQHLLPNLLHGAVRLPSRHGVMVEYELRPVPLLLPIGENFLIVR